LRVDVQLDRLLSERFLNPFDVLLLDYSATEDDIKKSFRNFSVLLHPDRCKDERAKDAFFIVDQAYKTL
jgi:DnaJ family protein C protein 8